MIYSCIPCSSPSFLFFSEHVFEHINTEVLRGPNRNFLTNIRAYFGKWWNSSYLKMCWLLIYVQEKTLQEYTAAAYNDRMYVCVGWETC